MSWRGQVDFKGAVAIGGLLLTPLSWLGGTVWTKHGAAEDFRREQAEHARQLKELEAVPGRVERMETTVAALKDAQEKQADAHAAGQREILAAIRGKRR